MGLIRRRLTFANVMACTAMFFALGGGAYAAVSYVGTNGQIHGCVRSNHQLLVIKPTGTCAKGTHNLVFAARGARGRRGATGAAGPRGAVGPQGPAGSSGGGGSSLSYSSGTQNLGGGPGIVNVVTGSAMTIGHVYAHVQQAPGSGKSWTFTVNVNGGAALGSCTITGAAQSCSATLSSTALSPGDDVDFTITQVAGPANGPGSIAVGA